MDLCIMFMNWEDENKILVFFELITDSRHSIRTSITFFFFLEWDKVVKIDKLSLKYI